MALFLAAAAACTTPWASPPIALAAGIVLALLGITAFDKPGKKASRFLIQACIVALGLRLDLSTLAHAAWDGLALALCTIAGAVLIGLTLGRLLNTGREVSTLITGGTAICGGSAIAAIGSSIRATASSMAIATGVVFVLNAIALFAFPPIARALHLTDHQFGLWAGVAIHDMSSVAGAGAAYDDSLRAASLPAHALETANVVKLTRVIWILPLALLAAWWEKRSNAQGSASPQAKSAPAPFPWFILFFVAASAIRTFTPQLDAASGVIKTASGLGFQLALFLIGAALSPAALRKVGWRALVQAVVLWLLLAGATLLVVTRQTPAPSQAASPTTPHTAAWDSQTSCTSSTPSTATLVVTPGHRRKPALLATRWLASFEREIAARIVCSPSPTGRSRSPWWTAAPTISVAMPLPQNSGPTHQPASPLNSTPRWMCRMCTIPTGWPVTRNPARRHCLPFVSPASVAASNRSNTAPLGSDIACTLMRPRRWARLRSSRSTMPPRSAGVTPRSTNRRVTTPAGASTSTGRWAGTVPCAITRGLTRTGNGKDATTPAVSACRCSSMLPDWSRSAVTAP